MYYSVFARDTAGNWSSRATVALPAAPAADTTRPTVALTSPTAGATVSGSSVALAATAADNVGVARVEFKVDGTLITSDLTAPYAATWNASSATAGSHTIMATAYDAAGNSTSSSRSVKTHTPVYRFWNRRNGAHFFTVSEAEKASLLAKGGATYSFEGIAYRVSAAYGTPLYRFYNTKNRVSFLHRVTR